MDALGIGSHDNPVILYTTAGYRKTLCEEDRIYGIMQVFGLKLGKSSSPGLSFSLAQLEVQFAAAINKKSPVWAQLYVHGAEQPAGRHWCISQSSRIPPSLVMDCAVTKSQCRIAVESDGQASFQGWCCNLVQLKAACDSAGRPFRSKRMENRDYFSGNPGGSCPPRRECRDHVDRAQTFA